MRYTQDLDKSSELLRLAIARMSKQLAPFNPITYAVWYEYVADPNSALRAELDGLLNAGSPITQEVVQSLYRKHIFEMDEEFARQLSTGVQRMLAEVGQSSAQTHAQASRYGGTLERWQAELTTGVHDAGKLREGVSLVLDDTRDIKASISNLNSVLDESRKEVEKLRVELQRAREEAVTDALTGLANRKGFDQALGALLAEASPSSNVGLVMFDIDHFKQINDTHGHLFGDRVIHTVAQILKANVKGRDVVCRYGGEEFALLLPETPLSGANALAEKIRHVVSLGRIRRLDRNETVGNITLSAGVTALKYGEPFTDFIERADAAMYQSKSQGRNRVSVLT
jgi:diguanylate cyclase